MGSAQVRTLPELDAGNAAFWRGGALGELRLGQCGTCEMVVHPGIRVCPRCFADVDGTAVVDGAGCVAALTHNHQPWAHAVEPPYTVVIVALRAAPHVRLTTNLIGCPPHEARVGLAVNIVFEMHGDVWLPMAVPDTSTPASDAVTLADVPAPVIRAAGDFRYERQAAITGVGSSVVMRRQTRPAMALATDACRAAIADAGLTVGDIDGVCAYPGSWGMPGLSEGGVRELSLLLGLNPIWHNAAAETPGQTGAVVAAMLAVASGLCRHVLCFTQTSQSRRPAAPVLPNGRVAGEMQWQLPFGAATPANWIALYASHYMARFGVRRETLGWLAMAARRHAARNPDALSGTPMSMDDYLAARLISTPFGLYDCDVPCDGAWAVVVSHRDAVVETRHAGVLIDAVGTAFSEVQSWDQGTLTHQPNVLSAARHMWSRSSLTPADVDVALLYDGFTFNALCWLEALGFCDVGEGAAFVDGAGRIGPGGVLPLNPHGGHLNCGRSNGFGHLIEAVTQLRGNAGLRQILDARVAVCSSGGGIPAGCMVLQRGN